MNRRNFLKSIGALAAAAASMPSLASIVTPNKYAESIRLLDECRGITDIAKASRRVDVLWTHLRENFPAPVVNDENLSACRKIFQTVTTVNNSLLPDVIASIRSIPPSVADEVYPIAVIKLGLAVYKIPVDIDLLTEYNWVYATYSELILRSMQKAQVS